MDFLRDWLSAPAQIAVDQFAFSDLASQAATTLLLLATLYIAQRVVRAYIGRHVTNPMIRQRYWDLARNAGLIFGLVLVTAVWLEELKTVSLLLTGLLAAFLIASKEVFLGFTARINLAISEHFRLGDRIRVNGVTGDVIGIGILYTWLLEVAGEHGEKASTGKVVVFPNFWLTQHAVVNFTHIHEYLWDEIELAFPLTVDFARLMPLITEETRILLKDEIGVASEHVQEFLKFYAARVPPVTPICYVEFSRTIPGDQFVMLTVRFVTKARSLRRVRSELYLRILALLREQGIPLIGSRLAADLAFAGLQAGEGEPSASA